MNVHFQDELKNASASIEKATGLPNWFYTSEESMAEEKDKGVCSQTGQASDLPRTFRSRATSSSCIFTWVNHW